MKGKTCVVTGGTSGIGRATALALARMGADVLFVGRNERAGQAVLAELRGLPSSGRIDFLAGDIAEMADVRRLARSICEKRPSIDVLINNAGARFDHYQETREGLERTFATNHLGHFLLTALLLECLLAAPQGRVITVASGSHRGISAAPEWIPRRESYNRKAAYASSKLANVVFAYELADRLKETTVTSNAVDPGGAATHLGRNNGLYAWFKHLLYHALKRELQSPGRAARTVAHVASDTEVGSVTGKYFCDLEESASSPLSYEKAAAASLWELSIRWCGLDSSVGKAWEFFKPRGKTGL